MSLIVTKEPLDAYLKQLDSKEQIVYEIAKDHLGSSFNLELSIGFIKWKKTYKPTGKK